MASLTKLRRESEDSRGIVFASPSASQTRGLASDFKAWKIKQYFRDPN